MDYSRSQTFKNIGNNINYSCEDQEMCSPCVVSLVLARIRYIAVIRELGVERGKNAMRREEGLCIIAYSILYYDYILILYTSTPTLLLLLSTAAPRHNCQSQQSLVVSVSVSVLHIHTTTTSHQKKTKAPDDTSSYLSMSTYTIRTRTELQHPSTSTKKGQRCARRFGLGTAAATRRSTVAPPQQLAPPGGVSRLPSLQRGHVVFNVLRRQVKTQRR